MAWTTPREVRAHLLRLWERGELLRPLVCGESAFPLRLPLKGPTSAELTDRFDAVRHWVAELSAVRELRIEWQELRHRVHGPQRLPRRLFVDDLSAALALLGKRREAEPWAGIVEWSRAVLPEVLPWLAKRPLRALELAQDWPRLLAVVRWRLEHPRPERYLRQVDLPGVHTKLIEDHRTVLSELLETVLPPDLRRSERTGAGGFASRYGFLDKPVRIRFRLLDERIPFLPNATCCDVTLDAESFARLDLQVETVFITENEINFLAFPRARSSLIVYGGGYGWEALAKARWLSSCAVHYWGDIDTHGFAILDDLRRHFGHVSSLLMDRATLLAHESLWGEELSPVHRDLPRLTEEERELFDALRDHQIRKNLRLEQERIGFRWVLDRLQRLNPSS